jgi:hypothetical protein
MTPKGRGGMCFCDMKLFNQVLPTRQAWRLIQFPVSLCARLLKVKYYLNGELVDTVFPMEISPMWRGIAYGLELLKKGIIWWVGSGSKIQIWREPWIERGPSRMLSLKRGRSRLHWVSQLMLLGRREWDVTLL